MSPWPRIRRSRSWRFASSSIRGRCSKGVIVAVTLASVVGNGTARAEGGWRVLPLGVARRGHTATLLGDRIVLLGGSSCKPAGQLEAGRTAEVFDARASKSQRLPDLVTPRLDHTATMLKDGRVVVVGGRSSSSSDAEVTPSVEV